MISGSNPNLLSANTSRKLIISPSNASQSLGPQSPMSEERKQAITTTNIEPIEEDRRDSRMSHDKSRFTNLQASVNDQDKDGDLKAKKF